jgi:hypothetical protein
MIIPTALQLILHFKSNVRTETPEGQGPQISCKPYQNLVAMNNISNQQTTLPDLLGPDAFEGINQNTNQGVPMPLTVATPIFQPAALSFQNY